MKIKGSRHTMVEEAEEREEHLVGWSTFLSRQSRGAILTVGYLTVPDLECSGSPEYNLLMMSV